mmetsp:Transcript_11808/g.17548  ORF Transcript_11808/g.17548 Transcript_11808/m.17548 type:complete len:446 (-) Transcript_11808:65-1402(-)|eukprot:CAMPEP_0117428126 /NCGR_PEP_ID=MMETSP0758-20121206/7909_1 /TAXON_ID=63605 /ORGANISM="Percolomonas cosmopolitus, Strain AE-1 (ATCC 50343)" /LENGTH=445 /DNA_ID=CAMNT_0005214321 /DNA_START=460 /DNA_END=1797 /DNA_ORIENTATION=+
MKVSNSKKKKKKKLVVKSNVYVRIRPKAYDGSGHDQNGESVAKSLDGWTLNSIKLNNAYMFSDRVEEYKFPKLVLGEDASQDDLFDTTMDGLFPRFLKFGGYDVIFFAYGQTGTGKTHSIFGPENSFSEDGSSSWGIYPRLIYHTLSRMHDESSSIQSSLFVSATEFYLGECFDLFANKKKVSIHRDSNNIIGSRWVPIHSMADLFPLIHILFKLRSARHTAMNQSHVDHGGSSRSHCVLSIRLVQRRLSDNMFHDRVFDLIDLAGAERPEKTGERSNASMFLYEMYQGNELSTGSQAFVINYELSQIRTEIENVTFNFRHKKSHHPPRQLSLPINSFISGRLGNRAFLGMLITLSQAPQCGWETWFSLQYGEAMTQLRARISPRSPSPYVDLRKSTKASLDSYAKLLSSPPPPSSPKYRFFCLKKEVYQDFKSKLFFLKSVSPS